MPLRSSLRRAHVAIGGPGKTSTILIPLCSLCVSSEHGEYSVSLARTPRFSPLSRGGDDVNIQTTKNPPSEIRGQLKLAKT